MMVEITWSVDNPPAEPPPGCADRQRWRSAYSLFAEHRLEDGGARCGCGERWPCPSYRLARRALITAFLQAGQIMVLRSGQHEIKHCRWCGRGIVSHPRGWVHGLDGL